MAPFTPDAGQEHGSRHRENANSSGTRIEAALRRMAHLVTVGALRLRNLLLPVQLPAVQDLEMAVQTIDLVLSHVRPVKEFCFVILLDPGLVVVAGKTALPRDPPFETRQSV